MSKSIVSASTLFNYLNNHNINDDFTQSLKDQFEKHNSLSLKQINNLVDKVRRHKQTTDLISQLKEEDKNGFINSLLKQFEERKSLSEKQIQALRKNINKSKNNDQIELDFEL